MFFDHCTDSASKFVEFLNMLTSDMRTTSISPLQMVFSCMSLHSYESRDRKGAWKAQFEYRQRRTIWNVQKFFQALVEHSWTRGELKRLLIRLHALLGSAQEGF